jgi:hypothetical protein
MTNISTSFPTFEGTFPHKSKKLTWGGQVREKPLHLKRGSVPANG